MAGAKEGTSLESLAEGLPGMNREDEMAQDITPRQRSEVGDRSWEHFSA